MSAACNLAHRVTCAVRGTLGDDAVDSIARLGLRQVISESARSVRVRRHRRRFGLPGYVDRLDNSPTDIYQFRIDPRHSVAAIEELSAALGMGVPARGTIYAEEVRELLRPATFVEAPPALEAKRPGGLLEELALITCIMSTSGSGEELARLALELGTGVPVVTPGFGTGMRDRLGLLRITVPPEKELVHLLAPAADAAGLMRALIEKGRLNRPGRGFIYYTPVQHGILDTSVTIGPRQHAASMEQVIAAIDDLKQSASWRRRFPENDPEAGLRLQTNGSAISLICAEEQSRKYSDAAMRAGAAGATIASMQCLALGDEPGGARERCTIVVRRNISDRVIDALLSLHEKNPGGLDCLEVQDAPVSFSYRARPAGKAETSR
jgi:hypothetical protein